MQSSQGGRVSPAPTRPLGRGGGGGGGGLALEGRHWQRANRGCTGSTGGASDKQDCGALQIEGRPHAAQINGQVLDSRDPHR